MKNNILLIAAVTIISLGVITAVIILGSSRANGSEHDGDVSYSETETLSAPSYFEEESTEISIPIAATPEPETETPSQLPETTTPESTEPDNSTVVTAVIDTARSLIGVPFADGGDSPAGFDNSGFIYYVLRQNGFLTCPRGAVAQSKMGTRLEYDELKEGDLAYFYNESGTDAGFGGIYIGDGKMIACLMPGTLVKEVDITGDYYKTNFYGGVSLS